MQYEAYIARKAVLLLDFLMYNFMKKFVWLLFGVTLLLACTGKKVETPVVSAVDSLENDTIEVPNDSIEKDTIEINPPRSADELFDDFIYSFSNNRRFQMRRISFPLPVLRDGVEESVIKAKEWEFTPMHLSEECYTTLLNSEQQLELGKDTTVSHVNLEWLDLANEQVRRYVFNKQRGEWRLNALQYLPLNHYPEAKFFHFYQHFASDSVFQRERVMDPVRFVTFDEDDAYQEVDGVIDVDQWFVFRPQLPVDEFVHINYGQVLQERNKRVFVVRGISNSMITIFTFERKEGHWMLTKFEN